MRIGGYIIHTKALLLRKQFERIKSVQISLYQLYLYISHEYRNKYLMILSWYYNTKFNNKKNIQWRDHRCVHPSIGTNLMYTAMKLTTLKLYSKMKICNCVSIRFSLLYHVEMVHFDSFTSFITNEPEHSDVGSFYFSNWHVLEQIVG